MPTVRKGSVRFTERADLLDFLLEVSTVTSETLDLDRLLANVAEIIKEVIAYDLFAILLFNERTRTLRMRYSIGHRDEVAKNLSIALGEGITGTAAATRRPVVVGDVRKDPRYLNAVDAVRAELAAPMMVRGKLVGVIDLESTQVNAYSEEDVALLALIASRVAIAIDNARLFRRAERQNRTLRVLAALSQEFSSILELDELLAKISETVRALIPFDAFNLFLVDEEWKMLRCRFSQRFDQTVTVQNIEFGKGLTGAAAESRQVVRVADVTQDPRYIPSHPEIRSEVAVPLLYRGRVIGVMDLESIRYAFFTEDHVRTLSLLAPQIAISVENARLYEELAQREKRMEQDLRAAYKLQSVLMPRTITAMPGLEVGVKTRPAREISGDLYDFSGQTEDYSMIAFGDVSGKGAAAALYGALISGLLRTLLPQRQSPAQIMRALNEALLERRVDAQYATLTLMLWNAREHAFTVSNAGALPPLICRAGQIIDEQIEGMPVGLFEDQKYDERKIPVQPGDLVLLHSDGVEDQLSGNNGGEEYGRERLTQVLLKNLDATPAQIAAKVFEDIDEFRGATPLTDDQTVIVFRVL